MSAESLEVLLKSALSSKDTKEEVVLDRVSTQIKEINEASIMIPYSFFYKAKERLQPIDMWHELTFTFFKGQKWVFSNNEMFEMLMSRMSNYFDGLPDASREYFNANWSLKSSRGYSKLIYSYEIFEYEDLVTGAFKEHKEPSLSNPYRAI